MSQRLPGLSAKQVLDALLRAGFFIARTSGSHHLLVHDEDPARRVTVPYHGAKDLPKGTLRAIIRQAGFTVEEFLDLL